MTAERDMEEAVEHLRQASTAIDRLWRATADRADDAVLALGEASMAVHRALVELRDWDEGATPPPELALSPGSGDNS